MNKSERLQDLLLHNRPVFTPSNISAIAKECGISYEKVLWFIGYHQNRGEDINVSLNKLVRTYRPDLIKSNSHEERNAV